MRHLSLWLFTWAIGLIVWTLFSWMLMMLAAYRFFTKKGEPATPDMFFQTARALMRL